MPWSETFALGVNTIDNQHRWLVQATNQLHDLIASQNPDRSRVREILEGMVDYSMNHFILEEELFARFDYPETVPHTNEHNAFTRKTIELLLRFEREESTMIDKDVLDFLQHWLINHILKSDKAYAPLLKANGL